ncbi:hypothetical protein [Pedobacter xixiisoli]|uniref:Uncharacterized protein n=1 Tax=Pedobacter xixiisoli TaxID=1476464 RepID=A0A285ZUN9_9SPHI|nr:hypothetical protein [Pedobacter xixiisoli]SOD13360.1 hypothetical protein SAMN06297358_1187 [Pedobacter xixiisoli]
MKLTQKVFLALAVICYGFVANAQETKQAYTVYLKLPGNAAKTYQLTDKGNGVLAARENLPLQIVQKTTSQAGRTKIEVKITAQETVYYNLEEVFSIPSFKHADCQFFLPGFWYHKNLRSPKEAPSFATSDSWQVREDRLSTPLTGIFNEKTGDYFTVIRLDEFKNEALTTHNSGEVILSGKTSIGFTGFRNVEGASSLVFGFPFSEAPKTYVRKLTLIPAVKAFEKLAKGETRTLVWEVNSGKAQDYGDFIAKAWTYSYDAYQPKAVQNQYANAEAKKILTNFFAESYVDKYDLKYYSGVELHTDDSKSTGLAEVGFVGRVLLNAYNALEYGEQNNNPSLVKNANAIFDSYLAKGFTSNGLFREVVDFARNKETDVYSIRRQSETVFAVLNYLNYEKQKGRKHPEWETKIKALLANFAKIQKADGSFPRKFDNDFQIKDASGGSTPSATLPLAMAYAYFKDKKYLEQAKRTAIYLEKEIIAKSDYFSSTLDANCEDKEASLYASTAMYYLAMVTKGKEQQHYIDLSSKAAYFCLTWYYTWDVPFAQGQMLGDVGFKTRGWGNVSVENNHVDVFIFEFATVLDWLAQQKKETRFSDFSSVIKSSMLQLMPVKDHMFNIGKVGYYPEVVQHTNWDYGKNGKGFYNNIFAPGWTVASLWQMLSPTRVEDFFKQNKK